MPSSDIHTRLVTLGEQIKQCEDKLTLMRPMSADHEITNFELRKRYKAMLELVDKDIEASERHGHLVSDLETSVRIWFEGLDSGSA